MTDTDISSLLGGLSSGSSSQSSPSSSTGGGSMGSSGSGSGIDAGGGLGIATGLLQSLQADNSGNKAKASMPDYVDPNQSSFLAELNQKRKSIETGADFAEAMKEANQTQAGTNDAILKASGGDSGGAIQGLLQAQQVAGMTKNKALAQGSQEQFGYNNLYNGLNNLIAARKMELQLYNTDRNYAQQASSQQGANQNLMGGLGRMFSGNSSSPAGAASSASGASASPLDVLGSPSIGGAGGASELLSNPEMLAALA